MVGTRIGGLNILIPNPKDIPGFVKELGKYKVNVFPAVNTLYNALLNNPDFANTDHSFISCVQVAGWRYRKQSPRKVETSHWMRNAEGYGLSERLLWQPQTMLIPKSFQGMIGLPIPSTEIAILDDDGNPVPLGESGEIAIRGPQVMLGYWNRPDETAKVMTADGFFKSGDVGIMDERGFTKIVDRKKDMILVSGFNVYPNEVEGVVASHPGVLECACIGVPDEHSGEAVKLFVVRKIHRSLKKELMNFCKEELTGYKKPKYIEFRTDLPKTNVGKILRRALRDEKPAAYGAGSQMGSRQSHGKRNEKARLSFFGIFDVLLLSRYHALVAGQTILRYCTFL